MRQAVQFLLLSGTLLLTFFGSLAPVWAQGHLEARYSATIAGIPIGNGNWTIDIADTHYTAAVSGTTSGLLRAFTSGQGNSTARATLNGGRVVSSIYASTITTRKKTDATRNHYQQR